MLRASLRKLVPSVGRFGATAGFRSSAAVRSGGEGPLAVLCILDGWGYRETSSNNAVVLADTPNFDTLYGVHAQRGQVAFLDACEREVGLPVGQIGNSEVGHMNIGAGRVVWQDIGLINNAIEERTMETQPAMVRHIAKLKASGGTCHVMGCLSPGGVHAMQEHIAAVANAVHAAGVPVVVHGFMDGRDVPPQDAISTLPAFLALLNAGVTVGTVTGRYYALDRDNRWERVGTAYDVMVSAQGSPDGAPAATPMEAVQQAYDAGLTDEFILPTVVGEYGGMADGDGLLMCNFRADRAREVLAALASPAPDVALGIGGGGVAGGRAAQPKWADVCGMVEYSDAHNGYMSALFPPKDIPNALGEVVARAGLTQLRAAETEKYPHVTFFLNGGREEPYEGEERILVASPKVATYDLQPEMSAPELGSKIVTELDKGKYNLVVINFANPDMVGHTGDLKACMAACEAVDTCVGDLVASVKKRKGTLIVTADHGNAEKMWEDATSQPHTAHTLNKVPVIIADYSDGGHEHKLRSGRLADLAPTLLQLLGVEQPPEMTGQSLIIDPDTIGQLQDGPFLTRPPMEGNPDAGTVPRAH
jgi:2,3-bisphosphoglycerate-independent phosphoglycerate mutase